MGAPLQWQVLAQVRSEEQHHVWFRPAPNRSGIALWMLRFGFCGFSFPDPRSVSATGFPADATNEAGCAFMVCLHGVPSWRRNSQMFGDVGSVVWCSTDFNLRVFLCNFFDPQWLHLRWLETANITRVTTPCFAASCQVEMKKWAQEQLKKRFGSDSIHWDHLAPVPSKFLVLLLNTLTTKFQFGELCIFETSTALRGATGIYPSLLKQFPSWL